MCHRQEMHLMTIPYRVRRALVRLCITAGVLTLLCILAFAAWMLWLNRYVIYTDEGAKLDFGLSLNFSQGQIAQPPAPGPDISISYGNTDELTGLPSGSLKQLEGWVVTADMLTSKNLAATRTALEALPEGSAVLLDVRNVRGEFYYTSSLGRKPTGVDADAVTALLQNLQNKGCYLIARFPAFRDRWYFLEDEMGRVPYGLPLKGGNGSLWEDVSIPGLSHYWFNPASTGTQHFLVQIVAELRNLGFDEVVLEDFCFPETTSILVNGDKAEILTRAANVLLSACATDSFAVSFVKTAEFTIPEGRSRIYLTGLDAAQAAAAAQSSGVSDTAVKLVFLTELHDTRFNVYSVLRPLSGAN